ncbi:SpoIIE family protein phosphatase [Frankia sp. Mgl5]|uniref:SpoIIE family protein phosphatase n=1 Tax=Frankia sp. Mgl5 TaxID=2933793 RepID=UPI00200BD1FF|nr:SpoIIE family protein phosphatase [Frankia sp. Mgl5]MCK9927676.1 SpoIIE family protein phosphatase [Frankia sp. Mgl5]
MTVGGRADTLAELRLDATPDAVAYARRVATRALSGTRWQAIASDVALVVSELATNAVLHGSVPVYVRLRSGTSVIRVEVSDGSRAEPVRPPPDGGGLTGRGMALVAFTATRWGVEPDHGGKTVWAELGEAGTHHEAVSDAPSPSEPRADRGEYLITLGDVPTDLLLAAKHHVDGLIREFALAAGGAATGASGTVPQRLAELLELVTNRFARPREAIKRQALAAVAAGEPRTHLQLALPLDAADAGEEYLAALEEIESYARAARLLTLESPPQHVAFRRWYVGSLVTQLRIAARGGVPEPVRTFEQYLLDTLDEVVRTQRTAERVARLQGVTAALALATTPEKVAEVVVSEGVTALGAFGGGLLVARDAGRLAVPGTVGYREEVVSMLRAERLDDRLPAADAIRGGMPVWLESRQDRDSRYPELAEREPNVVSMCALPLLVGDRVLGALRFSFDHPRLFDADERDFVLALAAQTALAVERARLFAAERRALERSAFLATLADRITTTLDPRRVLEQTTDLLVPRYAERAVAVLTDEPMTSIGDPSPRELALMRAVTQTGTTTTTTTTGGDGDETVLAVPLTVGGRTVAVLAVLCREDGPRARDEQDAIEEVARRAAVAVGNAQLYEQERRTALTLQRSLLPQRLPTIGGLSFAWRYLPGSAGALVGGDWYDVLPLDDGRVALVIGDVMGHGIQAAATMGQLRASARAHITTDPSPSAVLARLDEAANRLEQGQLATAALAVLDPANARLTLASAGHLPPLLVPPRGEAYYLPVDPGPPLSTGLPEYPQTRTTLEPGSILLFFTDGLVEDRKRPVDEGMNLLRVAATAAASPDQLCDQALAALGRLAGPDDDTALLAVMVNTLGPA